jgi:hypothetical protein
LKRSEKPPIHIVIWSFIPLSYAITTAIIIVVVVDVRQAGRGGKSGGSRVWFLGELRVLAVSERERERQKATLTAEAVAKNHFTAVAIFINHVNLLQSLSQ